MSQVLYTITTEDIERHREQLCQWAAANGIEPNDVAAGPGVTVERAGKRVVIVWQQIQRDQYGRYLAGGEVFDQVWTVRKATPLISPLQDHGLGGLAAALKALTLGDQTPGRDPRS